ncbi:MAG: glycosyltransferase family 4 protein [Candidatus Aenigmarchaeota archaeon]|nr:glycosyltransferase family 4 protein [Candidatus Aenigmarchaeota archaeon]
MKVMIVSDLAPPVWGGAENYVVNLGSGLVKLGHEVHWVTSKISNTTKSETLNGINIHRVPISYPDRYLFPGRHSFSLTSIIPAIKLARDMDVIQVNSLVAGFLGWAIAKYAGKPSLLFCHELYGDLWKKVGQSMLEKYGYPLVEKIMAKAPYDWFVCPSEYSKSTLVKQGTPKSMITVIPHGIGFPQSVNKDYRKLFKLKNNPTIGYLGRLNINKTTQAKNIHTLLKVVKLVSHEIHDVKLVLGGSGFEDLGPMINELGIEDNVVYMGKIPQDETGDFYKACDVVVCPALSDGFCFLLGEASACGVPTVATNNGSHPERIIHNETGLLSSAEPEQLRQNIVKLLKDKQLYNKFSENTKTYARKFTWDESVRGHLEIYNKLISKQLQKSY